MSALPAFILLKSNASGKFLCYGKNKLKGGGGGPTTNLSFSHEIKATADQLVVEPKRTAGIDSSSDPIDFHMIKFEVQEAKTAPGLVHIRTCYNNKYLIRKCLESESSDRVITAEAHEAEEDQSKPTCTLFKPVFVEDGDEKEKEDYLFANEHGFGKPPQKIQLIHVSHFGQHYLGVGNDNGSIRTTYKDNYTSKESSSFTFTAYDVTPNVILPERFTLMGHDDKYISSFNGTYLGFVTTDPKATNVGMWTYEPWSAPSYLLIWIGIIDGRYRYWRIDSGNGVNVATGHISHFGPVKVGNDHIALRARDNGNYVHRVNAGWFDGVNAGTMPNIMDNCRLRVGEPVVSRTVSEPYYDLENARIYDTGNFQMYSDARSNYTSVEQTGTFEVEYARSRTSTFNQSQTVNVGVSFNMSFRIPFVGSSGIELSTGFESTTEWGGSSTEEEIIRYTQNVSIPPGKRVTLRVMSTTSTCDVPFVCKVLDIMTDGTIREYTKTDLVYTGINSYNFDTVLTEQDAP